MRHIVPNDAMTARLATRRQTAGSNILAFVRGRTTLPFSSYVMKASTTSVLSIVKASGKQRSITGKTSIVTATHRTVASVH